MKYRSPFAYLNFTFLNLERAPTWAVPGLLVTILTLCIFQKSNISTNTFAAKLEFLVVEFRGVEIAAEGLLFLSHATYGRKVINLHYTVKR